MISLNFSFLALHYRITPFSFLNNTDHRERVYPYHQLAEASPVYPIVPYPKPWLDGVEYLCPRSLGLLVPARIFASLFFVFFLLRFHRVGLGF